MLTISKPLSAGQAQTYHAKEFTAAEQNYWKQGDTIEGEWHGKLAEIYGLHGAVGAQEFARLSEGQDPHTGEQLVRHRAVQQYQNATGQDDRAGRAPGRLGRDFLSSEIDLAHCPRGW